MLNKKHNTAEVGKFTNYSAHPELLEGILYISKTETTLFLASISSTSSDLSTTTCTCQFTNDDRG